MQPDRVKRVLPMVSLIPEEVTRALQTLVRDGLLTQQNQRRWASYRVAEDSPQSGDDSPQLGGSSPHLDRLVGLSQELQDLLPLAEPARKVAVQP